ncbi:MULTISPECIES: anthranilate phosphoribosyltransferase [Pseudoalteromonas]|uniref:Anthranilate phosphoribosyltransferase n=1 Tax=Pseudoalteromonas tetraodonis TaxID=43659 RepID=A0ABD4EJQ9_9GAMM|nr:MULTISPECIES: anthranilate phosphoribosyltransferase [Pseudoalteromonas]KYL31008.1 anthranilate phosphoribosyltransferase [Pseudoalteromonas spiralis]MDN3400651.1 anthranilate phosphoribosyltransferase [Pseudoalteromonas sp. APC 3213]MDN3403594.1 anthranilate phosphoribosyltransferase [Pseudoalteromonas sp. APC 3218]QWF31463.1 anthranilate phosphoribosyltransferase [Pseudoalteromonas sp. SiA1]TMS62394.1 anthranilate phosphoribosyltransferase [Pseudoalteromonas sp. S3173]
MTTQLQNSLNVQQAIEHVIAKQSLSYAQAKTLFDQIMQGNMSDIELSALLISLKMKGEISDEIAGAAASMRENAVAFITNKTQLADSCGTGGDGSNTINISTTAAIVAAAAGVNMVKHGNRSVSSNSGSADLLKALGINIDMTPEVAAHCLESTNFTFLFAPHYHSGVRHAMNVRTTLKTRTVFNILGPLANPAAPDVQLLGVYDESLCLPMAQTLHTLGTRRAMIVHGSGTDEIALHGPTQVVELDNGKITQYTLNPSDFDLANYSLEQLAGEGPQYNANASLAILQGKGSEAHNAAIIVNVAALLYLTGQAQSLKQGAQITHSLLRSGKAMDTLNAIIEVSHG